MKARLVSISQTIKRWANKGINNASMIITQDQIQRAPINNITDTKALLKKIINDPDDCEHSVFDGEIISHITLKPLSDTFKSTMKRNGTTQEKLINLLIQLADIEILSKQSKPGTPEFAKPKSNAHGRYSQGNKPIFNPPQSDNEIDTESEDDDIQRNISTNKNKNINHQPKLALISRLKTRKSYEKIHDDDALISRTVLSMTPTSKSQEIIENCSNNQQQQILHNSECPVYVIWPKRNLLLLTTNITNGDVGLPFKLDENIIFDALPREINPNQSVVWFVDPATKMDESMINKFIRKYMYDIQENDFDGLISLLSVMKNGFNHYTLLELESVEYSELNDEYKQYDGYLKYVLNLKDIYSQKKECELSQEHEKEIENILQTTLKDYNEDNELRSGSYETKGVITNDQTDNYAKDIFLSQYNRVSLKYHPEDDLNQILERLIFEAQTATLIDHREIIGFSQEILKQYDLNIQYDAMRTFHQIVSKPADIYTKSDNYRELFNYCLTDDQEISKSCKSYLIKQNATSYNTHNILVKGYKFKENYQELINDYKHDESTQFYFEKAVMIFEIGQDAKTKASYINYAITNEMEQRMKENNYMKTREIFNGNDSIYTNLQEQNRNLRKFNESQSKITRK